MFSAYESSTPYVIYRNDKSEIANCNTSFSYLLYIILIDIINIINSFFPHYLRHVLIKIKDSHPEDFPDSEEKNNRTANLIMGHNTASGGNYKIGCVKI